MLSNHLYLHTLEPLAARYGAAANGRPIALSKGEFQVLRLRSKVAEHRGVANGPHTGSGNIHPFGCARLLLAEAASAPHGSEERGAGSAG